uniref:Uncharacterized protein n=1 Tax=Megaselia scalaris TaxID=36166 RepID=T1GTN7_MEGSC
MDVSTWLRKAREMNIKDQDTQLNIHWYIPFYSLYYILTGLHLNFANSSFGVGRRFRRLNLALKRYYLSNELLEPWVKVSQIPTPAAAAPMTIKNLADMLT